MRVFTSAALIIGGIVGFTGAAGATTCSGEWDGRVSTSVEFLSGAKVRYCYETDCWKSEMFGDTSKFIFKVGDDGAFVEMRAKSNGYKAIWRNGNRSSKATLTCE